MTDDLVKRLREESFERSPEYNICDEAADRIEKLEEENGVLFAANVRLNSRADLDCDHYRDRIKKLEALVEQLRNDNSYMIDDYDTDFLRQEKRIEKLEAALREIIGNDELSFVPPTLRNIARHALKEGKDD